MSTPHVRIGDAPPGSHDQTSGEVVPGDRDGPGALPPFTLKALRISDRGWGEGWSLGPAPSRRPWMDVQPYSYQCPPLVVANQWGWQILCPTDVLVSWDGSPEPSGLRVRVDPNYAPAIKAQFGQGIVTFGPPWLFRTPPGWDLYVKGPSNRWGVNRAPLEGVVETWWLPYTFTLNWKVVRPGLASFARGEPLGHLMPVPHSTFRGARAVEAPIGTDPEAEAGLRRWQAERERRAHEKVTTHHLYRKAEGIADHLVKVPVPPVTPAGDDGDGR